MATFTFWLSTSYYSLASSALSQPAMATSLSVGFGQVPITPDVQDQWTDVNDDAQFDPDVDEWIDGNNNGQFDPVWIAGFQKQRPAQGVKDDLMAVAVVIEDGDRRMAIVATDTIGLMRKFVLDVRQSVPEEWQLDYLMVHATHNHEGPDTQGLWGPGLFTSGVDPQYMQALKRNILAAVEAAVANLEPTQLSIARIATDPLAPSSTSASPL